MNKEVNGPGDQIAEPLRLLVDQPLDYEQKFRRTHCISSIAANIRFPGNRTLFEFVYRPHRQVIIPLGARPSCG